MKVSYAKTSSGGNFGEVIEADNCTITLDIVPRQEEMSVVERYVNSHFHNVYNAGTILVPEFRTKNCSLQGIYNARQLLCVDDSKNKLKHDYGVDYLYFNSPLLGVIGACNINGYAYANNDSVRVSQNVQESSKERRYTHMRFHDVIDFPTNASNGSMTNFYYLPNLAYNSNVDNAEFMHYTPYAYPVLTNIIQEISPYTVNGMIYAVNSKGDYIVCYDTVLYYRYKNVVGEMNLSDIKNMTNTPTKALLITCVNDEFYILRDTDTYWSSTVTLGRLDFEIVDVGDFSKSACTLTYNSNYTLGSTEIFKSSFHLYRVIQCADNVLLWLWKANNSSSQWKLTKTDLEYNIITEISANSFPSYFRSRDGAVYHLADNLLLITYKDTISYLFDVDKMEIIHQERITRDKFAPFNHYKNRDARYAHCVMVNESHAGTPSINYFVISNFNWNRPFISVDLEEPLNKTNVETLKLIFDVELDMVE